MSTPNKGEDELVQKLVAKHKQKALDKEKALEDE